jgi:fucose 4-O-acetylase-like acetyltransferase
LFFIFSGIFTGLSLVNKSVKNILWNKFNLLFYPYLIWSAIQITLQIIFSSYTNSDGTYMDYLYIFYQPKRLAHFWYLPALFNASLVFVLIKSRFKIRATHHLLLGILFFLLAPFVNSISMMSNWMRFYIFLVLGDILAFTILKNEVQERFRKPVYFLALVPLFVIAQYYYFHVIGVRSLENDSASFQINYLAYISRELGFLMISLTGCATFILLALLIGNRNRWKWLRIIGFHSLYIYIMHVIVVGFMRLVFMKLFGVDNYLILLLISVVFGVSVPILFYNIIGKKYLWFLFSTKRDQKEQSRTKETCIRNPELRIPPLPSTINNM